MSQESLCVVGYYNGNSFPINIAVPQLNGSIQLEPGQFIKTKNGVKINDPIFERYCGPNRLQKETSKTKVPIVKVPEIKKVPTDVGFSGVSPHVTQRPQEKVIIMPDTGVRAFNSIQDAEKAGFFRPTTPVKESPIVETERGLAEGINNTKEAEVAYADSDLAEKPEVSQKLKPVILNIPERETPEPVEVGPDVTVLETPEMPESLRVDGPIVESASEISGFDLGTNLPTPVLEQEPQQVSKTDEAPRPARVNKEPKEPKVTKIYGCARCTSDPKTQSFRFRSQLADHVRRKHSTEFDAVMAESTGAVADTAKA